MALDVGLQALFPILSRPSRSYHDGFCHLCGRGLCFLFFFFFSSRRRHTRSDRDWSSDVCSSDLLAPALVETTFGIIADIRRRGTTVLMVEQNAYLALRMADRAYVMETGRIVLEGPARALLDDDHVRRAYLGA